MDYDCGNHKHKRGTIFTTPDGFKYTQHKARPGVIYLRRVLHQKVKCKGSAKLNSESNTIYPLKHHNHLVSDYNTEVLVLKSKCVSAARSSRERLSKVFKDVVRDDPSAIDIPYKTLESAMYRARREIEPPIPKGVTEFCQLIVSSDFGIYYKGEVQVGCETGVIFFSDKIKISLSEVDHIYFDGTFYTVPSQFYQLWTIFARFGRNVLPVIHCLLTSKHEEIYTAVLARIHELVPQLKPIHGMSDWEKGARNAVKREFQGIHLRGCHFHYTQCIWRKVQKLGLSTVYHNNADFKKLVRSFMSLPFLPEDQIISVFNQLEVRDLPLSEVHMNQYTIFKKYLKRQWIISTPRNELSIFNCQHVTNNGAENYYCRLKRTSWSLTRVYGFC
ncbi:hypothetical protein LOD99_869 [Oopsacas minuta]|uniref:MULE transposase domain-containing protein n=1 Tax=Oopsacas minuta TaxID=111878 RepID=A0AAV7K0K5_9METZ|nr:hypothetical protein LOD99_869 [Oopsacas minuta]